jgi:DNA repair exonuclease SbcCD nuclease subunit
VVSLVPTAITVLHTADWQIGKPYGRVKDPDKRSRLRQVRLEAIDRIAAAAAACEATAVVVAGDLFDAPTPSPSDVSAVCAAIGRIACPTLVIPGNHDHGGPGSIWQSALLASERQRRAPALLVLDQRQPLELEQLVVLPCGLQQRHDSHDPCGWLDQIDWNGLPPHKPRLVLAHGGVSGFAGSDLDDEHPSGPANLINLKADWLSQVDYVALGDWHGCKQVHPKAWYSGTPEADRFPRSADYRSGQVLAVTLQRGAPPRVSPQPCGAVGWHPLQVTLNGDADLNTLDQQVEALLGARVGADLLLLELNGQLSLNGQQQLDRLLQRWDAQLLRLKRRGQVGLSADAAELQELAHQTDAPLVAAVARQLQQQLGAGDHDGTLAQALLELHRSVADACA